MRLNKFLAAAGLGSRRSCEDLIRTGCVTINGEPCLNLATVVSEKDAVKVHGRLLRPEKHVYILLHKPSGYLCTATDPEERRTIFDLLPRNFPRLAHVGRLDKESEGLLILTNDGDLALRLTHPRFKIDKEYHATLNRPFDPADAARLLKGVRIGVGDEGGWAKVESVHRITPQKLKLILRQGMKRQIRLMLYALGYEVKKLVRVRIGAIRAPQLGTGEWRHLTESEVLALKGEPPKPVKAGARKLRTSEAAR